MVIGLIICINLILTVSVFKSKSIVRDDSDSGKWIYSAWAFEGLLNTIGLLSLALLIYSVNII